MLAEFRSTKRDS